MKCLPPASAGCTSPLPATIRIAPKAHPETCKGDSRVQPGSAVVLGCKDTAGTVTSGHLTSYHNRIIDAPRTFIVDKPAGVPLYVDLEKCGDRIIAVGLR